MLKYITKHAIDNVWCAPFQDHQTISEPIRLTKFGGAIQSTEIEWEEEPLPSKDKYYHIYQLGQQSPIRMDLPNKRGLWYCVKDLCIEHNLIIDIYNHVGVHLPKFKSFLKQTKTRNWILAIELVDIKKHPAAVDLNKEKIYIRIYGNAFFRSLRNTEDAKIKIISGVATTTDEIVKLQNLAVNLKNPIIIQNGYYVSEFKPSTVKRDEWIEIIEDGSIVHTEEFDMKDLHGFESILDNKLKYLIHPKKLDHSRIWYQDDTEIYLYKKNDSGVNIGLLYHRNSIDSVRMVTHKDYSLPASYIQSYVDLSKIWDVQQGLKIRIYWKDSGYNRLLNHEHNRLHELYKMKDSDVVRAMVGVNSEIPEWKVANLENSSYTGIMRARWSEIKPDIVMDAYGYNMVSKLTADTPKTVIRTKDDANNYIELGVGLYDYATAFEYDIQGKLLGWYQHRRGSKYFTRNKKECYLVEVLSGLGGRDLNISFSEGNPTLDLIDNVGYRFYFSPKWDRELTNTWQEIDEKSGLYSIVNGKVNFHVKERHEVVAVKGDSHFTCYDLTLDRKDWVFKFSMNQQPMEILYIPPAEIDVFLNGRALIENLDYFVNWPQVVICNKEYLKDSEKQELTIRGYGFCKQDLKRYEADEFGFIEHGLVSWDSQFNVREDRVIRLVIDGAVVDPTTVLYSEDKSKPRSIPRFRDGRPYCIEDVKVPIRGMEPYETMVLKERSMDLDKRISDYLSKRILPPTYPNPTIIQERYQIHSPFTTKIIKDIINGLLEIPYLYGKSDKDIMEMVKPYLWLLEFDPCTKEHIDFRFVNVHPHPHFYTVVLTSVEYGFLEKVISLYLKDRVDLTKFIEIGTRDE